MSTKAERRFLEQLNEAVDAARSEADQRHDFGRGQYSGAFMVAVKFYEILRRDEALKLESIKRGSP